MYSAQKGHSLIILVLVLAVLAGIWIFKQGNQKIISPLTAKKDQIYQDPDFKFQLKYPDNFEVVSQTEDEYSKLTQTEYRKNFAGYVGYQPPQFIKGLVVKSKDTKLTSSQFDPIALTLWIFENPKKLDEKAWFASFWYYPFIWGIFAEPQKGQIAPKNEATVSGILTKSAVITYSPGNPKFILLPKDDKIFLFKVIDDKNNLGTKVLDSFRLQ